jgi:hypothetical protein
MVVTHAVVDIDNVCDMDPVTNPFRPGAGRRPPVLAGREPILDAFAIVRRKVDELGEGDRGWILHGLRGVGKTVLLNELLAQVSDKGWIAAKVEVTPAIPLPVALVRSMRMATGRHPEPRLRRLLGVFKAFALRLTRPRAWSPLASRWTRWPASRTPAGSPTTSPCCSRYWGRHLPTWGSER